MLNRPGGFAMKFHNEGLQPLEDIVELIVLLEIAVALWFKSARLAIATKGIKIIAMINNVLRFDLYSMYYSISQGIILINATTKLLLITNDNS
jgi:hypothetical protein